MTTKDRCGKRGGQSRNVYENKGGYPSKAGMYMKTGRLIFSLEIN
jgi:hypothetical protein